MKLLIVEFSPAKGHKNLFRNICCILSNNSEVTAIVPEEGFMDEVETIVSPYGYYKSESSNKVRNRLSLLHHSRKIIQFVSREVEKRMYDAIICVTYDEISLVFCQSILVKIPVFLIHNNNLDMANSNRVKKIALNSIAKKTYHITWTKYMADFLQEQFKIHDNKILIWLHPLQRIKHYVPSCKSYDCVGISQSNDEKIIQDVIQFEKKTNDFKKNNLHVILRSKNVVFDDGYLKVISGYLNTEEYNDYILGAKSFFLPFPDSFQYRMSGVLTDAFVNRKPVIGSDILLFQKCQEVYPNITALYDLNTLIPTIQNYSYVTEEQTKEFDEFNSLHSDENLESLMFHSLEDVLLKNKRSNTTYDF